MDNRSAVTYPSVAPRMTSIKGDVEMPSNSRKEYFAERWLKIHCQVTLGIDMCGFRIMSIGGCEPQEESDNDRLSGELVPIIARDQFDDEAEKFLTRYCPEALDKPIRVPIEKIASDMGLQIIEDVPLSDELTHHSKRQARNHIS